MKTRTLTKLLSSVLCAALTMQAGWSLTYDRVNAADGDKPTTRVTLVIPDIYVGDRLQPQVTTDSTGHYFIYYKETSSSMGYSTVEPVDAGYYRAEVLVSETDTYAQSSGYAYFHIYKRTDDTATVTVGDVHFGDSYNPVVNTKSNGTASFSYKRSDAPDSEYTSTKPTAMGTYTVKAVIPETNAYNSVTCTGEFRIIKRNDPPTISISDVYIGDSYNPVVNTNSSGAVTITYKNNDVAGSTYTSTKPTALGNYTVRAEISETETYSALSCTKTFSIIKRTDNPTVSVSDIFVGDTYEPVVSTLSNGSVTLTYKNNDVAGSAFTGTKPAAAGNYTVKAVISETATYNELSCTDTFSILKRTDDVATVSVADSYVGDSYTPVVTTVSDGSISFIYKNDDIPDSEFTDEKPTAAGNYTVIAVIAETDTYNELSCYDSFTIYKRDAGAFVTVPDTFVDDSYDPVVTTVSDGTFSFLYKNDDIPDSEFTAEKPVAAGNYTVMAIVSETGKYNEITCTNSFSIIKRTPTAKVSIPDTRMGESYLPTLTTDSDGRTDAVYEYKLTGADDSTYKTAKPITVGDYTVRVTIPETDKYKAVTATDEFSIKRKIPTLTVNYGSPYVGTEYKPSITTNSDGVAKAVIEYKEKNALDDKYTTTAPTTFGTYIARVTIPETPSFASIMTTIEFDVIYLEAPAKPFELTGTAGKNDYYVSTVELKAPAGYTISAIYGGTYTESITYTDTLTSVYLKRTEDNALTSAIAVNKLKIDTQAPSFKAGTGAIASGSVMYISNINITVDDPNLKSLKVNGEPVNLSTDKDNVLTLSPGFGTKTFTITAEDEAGNVSNVEFTLKAEWLENKTIIPDFALPLEGNEYYNLDEGYWVVTKNTPEGPVQDSTVYSGGMPFYVEESGEYIFTRVT